MTKHKIAFVGNTSFSLYNFRLGIMKSFIAKGYEVYAIAPNDKYSELFVHENITYINLEIDGKGTSIFKDSSLIYNIYKTYKEQKFSYVFHYTIKPVIYGSIICRILKVPNIAITTGLGYAFFSTNLLNRFVTKLYKKALEKVDEVWFLNTDDRALFTGRGIINKSSGFVLNGEGVNSEFFCPQNKNRSDNKFIFLLLSRLVKEKGIVEFVVAAKNLKEKYPNIECQILGKTDIDNPSNIPIEKVEDWEREGYIKHFKDSLDVRSYIANADCVVLPSYYREGIPRCLLEAMSMERPIITTNNVGCIELIDDKVNGLMCKTNDIIDLTKKMEEMYILSENERKKMGENGRKKVLEKFDEKIIIEQYHKRLKLYFQD